MDSSTAKLHGSKVQKRSEINFQNIYDYVQLYQSHLQKISGELGRPGYEDSSAPFVRKNWEKYREEETVRNRFYQGKFAYFNPDEQSRTEKNVDYYAVNHVIQMLKELGIKQFDIAMICNVTAAIVSSWVTGTESFTLENQEEIREVRIKNAVRKNFEYHPNSHPDKYQWWAIAIFIRLPASLLDPFLMMVGAVFEPCRVEDQIIYSKMRADLKTPYQPAEHSSSNVHYELKKAGLDGKLCQEALLAFYVINRSDTDKTKSRTKNTGD